MLDFSFLGFVRRPYLNSALNRVPQTPVLPPFLITKFIKIVVVGASVPKQSWSNLPLFLPHPMLVSLLPMTNRINAVSRKAMRRGLILTAFDINALIDKSDRRLIRQATQPGHCLHRLLPPKTSTYSSYQLRKRQHTYIRASHCSIFLYRSLFI